MSKLKIIFKCVFVRKQARLTFKNPPSCFQGGNGEGNDRTAGSVGKAVVAVTIGHMNVLIKLEERITNVDFPADQTETKCSALRRHAVVLATQT